MSQSSDMIDRKSWKAGQKKVEHLKGSQGLHAKAKRMKSLVKKFGDDSTKERPQTMQRKETVENSWTIQYVQKTEIAVIP
jgi:hypothetical protein